jgi:hypothetical protein
MLKIIVVDGEALLIARPEGILDAEAAEEIVEFVEIHEERLESGANRFCDLTSLEGIDLLSADLHRIADRRRSFNPNDIHVKSAFLAADLLSFGIARIYEQILNSPRIEVRVWADLKAAAEWLGVQPDRLTP